ncbi:MAG: response regulator [Verrucomicrobia bacterium]|nr:response regulator [Verrucomicrobiota bacterium]
MNGKVEQFGSAQLRKAAENAARESSATHPQIPPPLTQESASAAVHELQVHQIELEMRNNELLQREAELDALSARYFQIYDQAPVGYLTINEPGLILEVNLTATSLLGVARSGLVTQPFHSFITRNHQQAFQSLHRELFETGSPGSCEVQMRKGDGTLFWAVLKGSTTRLAGDSNPVCLMMLNDITGGKHAEKQRADLQSQNEHLQRSESLGRMAGAIAHHFNNQLQVVILNLGVAMQEHRLDATLAGSLTGAMEASFKAARMSSLMLTYLGQNHRSLQLVDLSETCRSLLPMLQATMPQNITFESFLPSPGATISADPSQIQQVLMTLLTNAWEASSSEPNIIRLSSSTVSGSNIPAANRYPIDRSPEDSDYACLEVADSGCGIPVWDMHLIFDPFFSTKFTGRGLGLPVVLGIIRSNHGFITVESKQGSGSKFRVFLPMAAGSLPLPAIPVAHHTKETGVGTVMVIDDDDSLRELIGSSVVMMGFTVIEACDGVEALELFRRHHEEIRLVISDLSMPRMDGWQTLEALRKVTPGIPVILSSGHSESLVMSGAHTELPQNFLMKPYELNQLRSAIFSILETDKPTRNI